MRNGINGWRIVKISEKYFLVDTADFFEIASPELGFTISRKIEQKSSQTNLYIIIKASDILNFSKQELISFKVN